MLKNINIFSITKYFFLSLLTFLFTQNILLADALSTIKINKKTTQINLFNYIEILEDKSNELTIKDIIKEEYIKSFKPTSIVGNSFGYSKSTFWVRFSVEITEAIGETLYIELEYPLMDYATLYVKNKNNEFTIKESGELLHSSLKDVNFRNHLFIINQDNHQKKTYYMRVKSESSTQIPLNLLTSNALIEDIDGTNLLFGLYYGNMILLMIAAFIAFIKIGDKVFLTYSFYLLSYLFFNFHLMASFLNIYLHYHLIILTRRQQSVLV